MEPHPRWGFRDLLFLQEHQEEALQEVTERIEKHLFSNAVPPLYSGCSGPQSSCLFLVSEENYYPTNGAGYHDTSLVFYDKPIAYWSVAQSYTCDSRKVLIHRDFVDGITPAEIYCREEFSTNFISQASHGSLIPGKILRFSTLARLESPLTLNVWSPNKP
jgi:hypothetical protein